MRGRTIRNQFLFSLLLVLMVPLVLLGVVSPLFYTRTVEDLTVNESFAIIGQVNRHLDEVFRQQEQLMTLTAHVPALAAFLQGRRDDAAAIDGYLAAVKVSHPELTGIVVLNGKDEAHMVDFTRLTREPLSWDAWARLALARPGAMHILARPIGRNILNRRTMGDNVVSMAKAFGHGVILFDLHLKTIETVFSAVSPESLGFLFLVDRSGSVVYSPVNPVVYRIPPGVLESGRARSLLEVDGRRYQVLSTPSAYTGLSTVAVYDLDQALGSTRFLGWMAFAIGFVTLGLALLMSLVVSESIARPIVRLRRLMEDAEAGNLDVRYPDPPDDEVGRLGQSFNAMIGEIRHLLDQVYEEQRQKREAEFRILQAQIKPHFLYNTLDTIHWMAQEKGAGDIVGIVDALTRLFRISLSKGKDVISLRDEIDHVTAYLVIQKIRYQTKFDYSLHVPGDLLATPVVKLTLQPLVENAIYHGIKEKEGSGRVDVRVYRDGDALVLEVSDNGVGLDAEALERLRQRLWQTEDTSDSGFGVFSVHQRVRLAFGERWGLEVTGQPGQGVTVRVRQPLAEGGSR